MGVIRKIMLEELISGCLMYVYLSGDVCSCMVYEVPNFKQKSNTLTKDSR